MSHLTIRNVGRMWRVLDGNKVKAFASSYAIAKVREEELSKGGCAEREAAWFAGNGRSARCQQR